MKSLIEILKPHQKMWNINQDLYYQIYDLDICLTYLKLKPRYYGSDIGYDCGIKNESEKLFPMLPKRLSLYLDVNTAEFTVYIEDKVKIGNDRYDPYSAKDLINKFFDIIKPYLKNGKRREEKSFRLY